jgi:2-dehydro-3-deoxygalactonokinase
VRIATSGDVRILPGIAQADAACPDVMRGEETQLLGAVSGDFSGLVCIPGTHCKWIRIEAGCVIAFSTYMTGELFAVLGKHSILVHAMDADQPPLPHAAAFRSGLDAGIQRGLEAELFRLRAAQLLGFEQRADGAARLSGLLIGAELADAGRRYGAQGDILLIAAGALGELYAAALRQAGWGVATVDAEQASQSGLARAAMNLWGEHF